MVMCMTININKLCRKTVQWLYLLVTVNYRSKIYTSVCTSTE